MITEALISDALDYASKTLTVSMRPFCVKIINNLLKKHGRSEFIRVVSSEAGGEVNNVLTYMIEVGSLKYMQDRNIIVENHAELLKRAVGVAYCMNVDLCDILRNLNVISDDRLGYYNWPAIEQVVYRVVGHCEVHLKYNYLPMLVQQETLTIDEMFVFYLGDYMV